MNNPFILEHLANINLEVWKNLHVNNGHFPKSCEGHRFKTTTTEHKPQSSATGVVTAGIPKAGDNEQKAMPSSPARESQLNEMRV